MIAHELFSRTSLIKSTRSDRLTRLKLLVNYEFGICAYAWDVFYFEAKIKYAALTILRFKANITIEMPNDLLGNKQAQTDLIASINISKFEILVDLHL